MNISPYYQLWRASQAEIICSSKKDEQYFNLWINSDLQEILQGILGSRVWIEFRHIINVASRVTYFAFTSLSGRMTLGEEYTNVAMVKDVSLSQTPNFINRLVLVILQSLDGDVLKRLTKKIYDYAQQNKHNQLMKILAQTLGPDEFNNGTIGEKFALIYKAHLIAFFLYGNYYHLSNRLMNVQYGVNDSSLHFTQRFSTVYRIIGYLYLLELLVGVIKLKKSDGLSKKQFEIINNSSTDEATLMINERKSRCSLCMEPRRYSTSTLCGHLFCWDCIHQWLKYKQECAVCRNKVEPSRLIKLNNYYP